MQATVCTCIYNESRTAFCEGYFYLHLTQVKGRLNNPPTSLGGATFEEKRDSLFCVKYKAQYIYLTVSSQLLLYSGTFILFLAGSEIKFTVQVALP